MRILVLLLSALPFLKGEFQCPVLGSANCSCTWGFNAGYELSCPRNVLNDANLMAKVQPKKSVQLQCRKSSEDLKLLEGLEIGPVEDFVLELCPLPQISIKELMKLGGISSIQALHIRSQRNHLTRQHLTDLHEVTKFNLYNNALTSLPEDLFYDMSNLTQLELTSNELELPRGIFKPVPKLEVLELGSNNLTHLEPGIFRNLTKLRLLNLWSNRLQNLTRAVFSDVPNLESLDLNTNGLVNLTPDIFADLSRIKIINLKNNKFVAIPQNLFLGTPSLEKFHLSHNRQSLKTLPKGLLSNLTKLKEVYLNNCNLTYLPEDLVWGSTSLLNLGIQGNLLTELPEKLFKDNQELKTLDLSQNHLKKIPDNLLESLEKLVKLNLSHNKLTQLSQSVFSNLREIEEIYLHHNQLYYIYPQAFKVMVKLRIVNLSYNKLNSLDSKQDYGFGSQSVLQYCSNLIDINLSHNNISEVYADWTISMVSLKTLNLSYNSFKTIVIADIQNSVGSETNIDLTHNYITFVDFMASERNAINSYENKSIGEQKPIGVILNIKHNPIECDCHVYDLVRYYNNQLDETVKYMIQIKTDGVICEGPEDFKGYQVEGLHVKALTCQIVSKECPINCQCYVRPADKGLLIDCSNRGLTQIPESLSNMNVTLLDGAQTTIDHIELDLKGNRIKQLPTIFEDSYKKVTKLYLSNNNITMINTTSLSPKLEILELDGNNLTSIDATSIGFLNALPKLQNLTLHKNPWLCSCESKNLLTFVQSNYKKIPFFTNITCSGGAVLSKLTIYELCPVSGAGWTFLGVIVAVLGLLIGGLAAVYYRYQREIRVWLYARRLCLWCVTEEELDKDKIYDAFISYSHQDEDFVVNQLAPGLENGPNKFKLCLHYRDWIVGDMIPNQIVRTVNESRRTVVVLSPNFIESVWGRMEFRTAHSQALSEGRARVIVILYGDIGNVDNLDPELKAYLSMNTYVKWGDPWFWDKLRYALPHPPELSKGIPLILRHGSKQGRTNDKSILVNGSDPANPVHTPVNSMVVDPITTLSNSKPV